MEKNDQNHSNFVIDSLKLVQQGLKSMQDLQRQTAETHQKFLETQSDASRSLQEMMESTQRLVAASMGIKSQPAEPDAEPYKDRQPKSQIDQSETGIQEDSERTVGPDTIETSVSATVNTVSRVEAQPVNVIAESDVKSSGLNRKDIEKTLLEVVSQLTGYPVETLGLDMDIEADLGIDSIKRVEILSTLEEEMPALPSISPDIIGTSSLAGDTSIKPEVQNNKNVSFLSEVKDIGPSHAEKKDIEKTLLEVVSNLTGYPVETLGLDMDIEADLGIDSIKRVEILSTLEEKLPDLPSISPDVVGTLKTLGQIAEYLKNEGNKTLSSDYLSSESINLTASENQLADSKPDSISKNESSILSGDIDRKVVSVVEKKFHQGEKISIPSGRKIFITDDKTGLSQAIVDEFELLGINTVLISSDILKYKEKLPKAAGLIIVGNPEAGPETEPKTGPEAIPKAKIDNQDLKDAFLLANHVALDLLDSAEKGGAIFATITRLDGAFGFKGRGIVNPMQGGLIGLAKTAAIEWKGVCCRAIDVEPGWEENLGLAKMFVTELLYPDPISRSFESC
ncbi:MAG: hypothetical protein JRJ76_17910 [Deltaproteobacteria bacterium]|nr:hypothetical protein [Deltaproteobacteria bacterium]